MKYRDEGSKKVHETAQKVAEKMGWIYDAGLDGEYAHWWYAHVKKDNLCLFFGRYDAKTDKMEISGSLQGLQNFAPYGRKNPAIKVTLSKGASKIVADIQRKILPEYTIIVEEATKAKKQHDENEQARDQIGKQLAEILGTKYRGDIKALYLYDPHCRIEVQYTDVKWEFETTRENALKVAEFLKVLRNK